MPYLKMQTNHEFSEQEEVVKGISNLVANILGKPETYVMVALENGLTMSMGGSTEDTVFIELKSLGLPESSTKELSNAICIFLEENYSITPDRVYINFINVERHMWGWNNGTF